MTSVASRDIRPSRRWGTWIVLLALLLLGTALYGTRLGYAPIYFMHDESQFALQSQSIAASGRDMNGVYLPVFFAEPEFPAGRDPMIMYATAAVLKILPFSQASARLATSLVGVVDIALAFLVARALFGGTPAGLLAAAFMALTPVHFIRARLMLSPMYSVPFVLLWLLAMIDFDRQPAARRAAIAGAWLAAGLYTYLACVVMMPMYLLITCGWAYRVLNVRAAMAAIAAFVAVSVPMLAWYVTHPERFRQIFGAYKLYSDAPPMPMLQGIQARLAMYWSFFNPDFLFLSGDSSLINSTRLIGFFPMAFAVLIPIGLYAILKSRQLTMWLIGIGLLTAPLASIISGGIEMNRIMFAIPFGVLVSTAGMMAMMRGSVAARVAAIVLAASVAYQFTGFYSDYMGDYRARSATWFGGNLRDAIKTTIANQPAGDARAVLISVDVPFAWRYWRFFAIEAGREDLIDKLVMFKTPPDAAPGTQLICPSASPSCQALIRSGQWRHVATATEPDQTASFEVLARQSGS